MIKWYYDCEKLTDLGKCSGRSHEIVLFMSSGIAHIMPAVYAIFEIKTSNFQHWLMVKAHMFPIEIVNLQDCCKTVWVEIVELLWSVSYQGFY